QPQPGTARIVADFVGPVCESGDILARGRETAPLAAGDRVAILTSGAYGAVMASTYNTRLLVPEVLIRGGAHAVIRPRQDYAELIGLDRLPDWQLPGQNRGSA
ncbi:MAG: diaminopimelate decarboxylase, partial [Alphaproteobacteria bacterium]|nr:diaminopimelate decarboxylase [Alphaproteobacteria bacterium]